MTTLESRVTGGTTRTSEKFNWADESCRAAAKANAPAIFATRPIGVSEDYQFCPTHKLADMLVNNFGMRVTAYGQQWSRARNPLGQEHVMRFGFLDRKLNVGDSQMELIIINSNNGRRALRVACGVFRLVCSNGMVVADEDLGFNKIRHFGEKNSFEAMTEITKNLAAKATLLNARIKRMQEIMLTPHQQNQFAREVAASRGVPNWVEPGMVLEAKRVEDEREGDGSRNLWVTYNVIQEHLTKGDVTLENEGERRRSLRPINGAMSDIVVNAKMWEVLQAEMDKHEPVEGEKMSPELAMEMLMNCATVEAINLLIEQGIGAHLTPEQRKKVSARKSYLKRKEAAAA